MLSHIITHGDNRKCPNVVAGVWRRCQGHEMHDKGTVGDLRSKIQYLVDTPGVAPSGHFVFPDGDVWLTTEKIKEAESAQDKD